MHAWFRARPATALNQFKEARAGRADHPGN
jgi:hypothetical protein